MEEIVVAIVRGAADRARGRVLRPSGCHNRDDLQILIVDDNPTFRAQAARLCEREGFSTITAGSVSELAAALAGATPDLVLIDIELPQIPGHRLGALIRSRGHVPIVLVSALSEERVRRLFEASDADGWICKPLTRDKLVAAVTRFVTQPTSGNESAPRPEPQIRASSSACNVLLVEDEPVIAARIEGVLSGRCSVTTVPEGDAAIDQLLVGAYDLVLLDLTLPRLSGFDVLRHLLVRQPELLRATIVMTAASDESLQFIDRNAIAGVLRKPFEFGALTALVDGIVARR
jgi:DNA-binding response OmpR family regulator